MKIRTARYFIKEGIVNTYRNILMSLASIIIVAVTFIILGIFFLFVTNIISNTDNFKNQLEVQVFCRYELADEQVDVIEKALKGDPRVLELKKIDKKEAMERAKKTLGNSANVLDGVDESFLPVTFAIKLKNPGDSASFEAQYKNMQGILEIKYSQRLVDLLVKFSYWIEMICGILLVFLSVISVLIISNTVKLTVFARRKEINIMKYVGATDWFIRWPFIVEGIIISIIGAVLAMLLTSIGYSALTNVINKDLAQTGSGIFSLVQYGSVFFQLAGIYTLLALGIGSLSSALSLRKHLHV